MGIASVRGVSGSILVTGGAGYIGSHVVFALRTAGWPVVVLDDLSTGGRSALAPDTPLVEGDIGDRRLLKKLFDEVDVLAVLHFAGAIRVEESVRDPLHYYRNNTVASHALITCCVDAGIRAFIFSSTAAIYGVPTIVPVPEDTPARPINPYGWSKLMTERILIDAGTAHGLTHVILRYFNVAGADPEGRVHPVSSGIDHLLKVACETALGRRRRVPLFGTDYPTPDGTGIRDFVHVSDLADAHLRALDHLISDGESRVFNCGYGHGHSVRAVLDAVSRVTGRPLDIDERPRRTGDAPEVVADARRIRTELGWRPRHDDLEQIVRDAMTFERRRSRAD